MVSSISLLTKVSNRVCNPKYKLTFLVSLYLPKHTGSETGSRDIDLMGSAILKVGLVNNA